MIGFRRTIAIAVAGLLLVAALLKLNTLVGDVWIFRRSLSFWDMLSSPGYLVLTLVEVWVALMLISRPDSRRAWRLATLLFAVFAVISAWDLARGAASCKCFGRVLMVPWLTLTMDLVVLFLLLWFRPVVTVDRPPPPAGWMGAQLKNALAVVAGFLFLFVGIDSSGLRSAVFGSPLCAKETALQRIADHPEYVRGEVLVSNRSRREVKLRGATQYCAARLGGDFPQVLKPGETRVLPLIARVSEKARHASILLWIYADSGATLSYRFVARTNVE